MGDGVVVYASCPQGPYRKHQIVLGSKKLEKVLDKSKQMW